MQTQSITTDAGEELVVVVYKRREYDALMARLGDEAAEDRMTARMVDAHIAEKAAGTAVLLPDWFAFAMAEGVSALRAVRKHRGETQGRLAQLTGLPQSYISEIERGEKPASAEAIAKLAAALECEADWLT